MIIRDNLLILHKNICCDPSSEPSWQDGLDEGHNIWFRCRDDSDEGSKYMVSIRNKKSYHQILPLI